MKTPHPLFFMRYFYIILIGLFLLSGTACSDYFELGTEVAQDPVAEAKADFSQALGLWNLPENFDRSGGKTETELLQNRLEQVYEKAKNLLLLSGIAEERLQNKSKAEVFILAVKIYGGHYDN